MVRASGREETSLVVARLRPGDCVELKSANSRYTFWVEFPALSIGVAYGGRLQAPGRIRLVPEGTTSGEQPSRAVMVGERVQLEILGPDGRALRRIVTSPIANIAVRRGNTVAA